MLDTTQIAKVLGLAIALGGSTLTMFMQGVPQSPVPKRKEVCEKLEIILEIMLGYSQEMAQWLPSNLHRLHRGSTLLLNNHFTTSVL